VRGFISIAPPPTCTISPSSPLPLVRDHHPGRGDEVVTPNAVQKLVDKLRTQRHITIHHSTVPGANHFFQTEGRQLMPAADESRGPVSRLPAGPELHDPLSKSRAREG
jgi:alpha/beta superfamily hydrolase